MQNESNNGYTIAATDRTPHDIGWAVKQMWYGQAVCRRGWNGRGMLLKIKTPDVHSQNTLPYVWMQTVQGDRIPWLCSQTDLLATDWQMSEV